MRGRDACGVIVGLAALAACGGGNNNLPPGDGGAGAGMDADIGPPDAVVTPPPPTLGAQLDRVGRPGVSEMLVAPLGGSDAPDRQAAYRQAGDPATWRTTPLATNVTIESELKTNLAALDAIDNGFSLPSGVAPGCGNSLAYHEPASTSSYLVLADLLADDQLYLDTSLSTCPRYFSLELAQISGGDVPGNSCGGRTLRHDALGTMVSTLVSGLNGLSRVANFAPLLVGTATVHTDVSDSFPFLGAPNP